MMGHSELVSSVAITFNGNKVISGSHDGTVKVWNTNQTSQLVIITIKINDCQFCLISGKGQIAHL